MLVPVGLEGDLRHLPAGRPLGGDEFGALRRATVQQHHIGVLGVDLVEAVPDQGNVVEFESSGECDLRSRWQNGLGLGPTPGGEEVSGVDQGRGERAVVDE